MTKYRVLVIDDTIDILRTLQLLLEEKYEVILAKDGLMGYQKSVSYLPDMIIMDIMMPKLSGYQLCDQLKKHPILKDVPLIFMSAKGTPLDQQYGLKKGAAAYIPKPFDPRELIHTIDKLFKENTIVAKDRPTYDQVLIAEEAKDRVVFWTG